LKKRFIIPLLIHPKAYLPIKNGNVQQMSNVLNLNINRELFFPHNNSCVSDRNGLVAKSLREKRRESRWGMRRDGTRVGRDPLSANAW